MRLSRGLTAAAGAGAVLLTALVALAGCGFQLQAKAELPPEMAMTWLDTRDPYSHFVRRLSILLEQNGVQLVGEGQATAVLEIPVNVVRKDILTIGDTARVREFRIEHEVRFRLRDATGAQLLPEQQLLRRRVISFDEQDILAATREEEFLREELADTLSREVLRRLARTGG